MRLVILCEGDTEERVLKDFLAPYCTKFGKNVHVISSKGAGNLKNEFQTIAELELRQDRETFVFCLIDVLNAPFSFPKEVMNSTEPYEARYDYIRRYMQELIGEELRSRFFAFPVLMELETWLLADIEALKDYFSPPPSESLRRPPNPESVINPSEELGHWMWRFRNMKYKKTLHGPKLFKLASAKRVYEDNCPHFIQMINELLRAQDELSAPKFETIHIPNEDLYLKLVELEQARNVLCEEVSGDLNDDELSNLFAQDDLLKAQMLEIQEQINRLYSKD